MRRPSPTLMTIVLLAGFLAALASAAWAQPIPKDAPASAIKRERFLRLYARTAGCMREASVAMLRQGARNRDDVMIFSTVTCGKPLADWLQREEGASQNEAFGALDDMAGKALDAALHGPDFIIY